MKMVFYLALSLSLSMPCALADWFADYIEYRFSPTLGSIKINTGTVRGQKYCDYITNRENISQLATRNIFSCADSVAHTYKRTARLGKYTIGTVIKILPPTGHGYGGAVPTRRVQIFIDNRKKIDCSFDCVPWLEDITVSSITLYPEDGIMEIDAVNKLGKPIFDSLSKFSQAATFLSNPTVITDDVLRQAADDKSE
jgi:hypothetical protein